MSDSLTDALGELDAAGWLSGAQPHPTPNCDARPEPAEISLLVVHNISLPPGQFGGDGIIDLFLNRLDPTAHPFYAGIADLRVSAHFLIRRDGTLLQFVPCGQRAWHAGTSAWKGRTRCNDFSLGVELEGTDNQPFTAEQYARLAGLITRLRQTYPLGDLAGHSEIAPGRKTDPGPHFDWARLNALLAAA